MKKLIALFAFVATLSFVACNGGGEHDADQAAKDSIEAQRVADSAMAAEQAMKDSMAAAEEAAMMADSMMSHDSTMMEDHMESTH